MSQNGSIRAIWNTIIGAENIVFFAPELTQTKDEGCAIPAISRLS